MNYSNLRYNIFYLYNRDFYNCLVYGHLINNRYFKDKFKTEYQYLIDRSKASPTNVTREVETVIGMLQGKSDAEKQQIILPYTDFFNSTANKFVKDDIIIAFDKMLELICGDDEDSGLRNITNKLSLSRLESDLTNKGVIFPSLFSDIKNPNLKEQITETNKVYFTVNNKNAIKPAIYLFDNSIDYSLTPNLKTDYTDNYNPSKPEEFTYVGDAISRNKDRGFRMISNKNIAKEHEKGYAVDTSINFTGKTKQKSIYSMPIKKLMIMNYLFTSQSDSIIPYRFEISSVLNDTVPHIHMDKKQNSYNGISLFKAKEFEMMNGGSSSTSYYTELKGKVIAIITDMIEKTYIISSEVQCQITATFIGSVVSNTYYEKQKIRLNNDTYTTAGEIQVNDVLYGGYVVTEINEIDIDQEANYDSYVGSLDEYKRLDIIVFGDGSKGYSTVDRDTYISDSFPTNLDRSVEYLSYVINGCIVTYFNNNTIEVDNTNVLYNYVVERIKVDGNFIVIEK